MDVLYGKTLDELKADFATLGMPKFTAVQVASWLYKKFVADIDAMSDLSLKNRELLKGGFFLGLSVPSAESESVDGTKKYLFSVGHGNSIESAYIPDRERATLCVSSQAGCKMGCRFCMTGRQGFSGSLTANEIINQIVSLPERNRLTNVVYMGMGEPLDNPEQVFKSLEILTSPWGFGWSSSRVTLSTVGVIPNLKSFLEQTDVHLAVSLHNPFHEQRAEIMPIENVYPIKDVVNLIKSYDLGRQRRVSFEYIVMKGMNDSAVHIKELARLLDGLKCRINLIRFHSIPDSPYFSPDNQTMIRFRDALSRKGITTTIRASRGEDIKAACGLLSTMGK